MDHAQARLRNLSLDPKRIAATSVAIAVHLLVLMLLLLPAQRASTTSREEEISMIVVPEVRKIPKLMPLPVIRKPEPVPVRHTPVEQVMPVDTTPSPIDNYLPSQPPEPEAIDSFEGPSLPPAFAQIVADLAPAPPYPPQALRRGLSGEVTLRVVVDARGQPIAATIEKSSGSKLLDEAARKFVLARWHFVPAMQGGVPIEAQALIPINFVLDQ